MSPLRPPSAAPVLDLLDRPLGTLRLSVTDRCNLRCHYCMPSGASRWLPHADILTFEELSGLADVFGELGVAQVRLTGGEPLMRPGIDQLVARLAARPWVHDLALTTNGVLLAEQARALKRAGLHRLTVSLDTLRRDRFQRLARADALARVLAGIAAARDAGFTSLKLDTVVTRGDNDDELVDLIEFARRNQAELRFIEYMRVGRATRWRPDAVVPRREIVEQLEVQYGPIVPLTRCSAAPASRFRLPDGLIFGIISSTTEPFCRTCTRARLTADGVLFLCLHADRGLHLGRALRAGAPAGALRDPIRRAWKGRMDRGAEEQFLERLAGPCLSEPPTTHTEMNTRGG